jgi:hypothetical protein
MGFELAPSQMPMPMPMPVVDNERATQSRKPSY